MQRNGGGRYVHADFPKAIIELTQEEIRENEKW